MPLHLSLISLISFHAPFPLVLPPLVPSLLNFPPLAPDKEKCQGLVRLFISHLNDDTLLRFIRLFLLQPNSSSLRWQAHSLIHTLYLHGTCEVSCTLPPSLSSSLPPSLPFLPSPPSFRLTSLSPSLLIHIPTPSSSLSVFNFVWPAHEHFTHELFICYLIVK